MTSNSLTLLGTDPDTKARAHELTEKRLNSEHRSVDNIFMWLNLVQWVAAIAIAVTISPRTWAGAYSAAHIHVWAALLLGGILASLPIALAYMNPGKPVTRYVIAAAQMLWSALLIHLCGGRIEVHFHVFVSLAFLSFYRDIRVLCLATLVITIDHIIRGVFWPQSVYGVLTASPWRVVEHTAWVLFEDIVLFISILSGLHELRNLGEQQANLEQSHLLIEKEVSKQTEQLKKKEVELFQMQKMEAIGLLAGGIAHEFNNLLQAIRGYTSLAIQGISKDCRQYDDLQQVLKASDSAAKLTRGLLEFGRKGEFNPININPNKVITDLTVMIRPLISEQIKLEVNQENQIASVHSDKTLLQQILMNLCLNARDAMEFGGTLRISTSNVTLASETCASHSQSSPGNFVLICVSDNGCGMTKEVQQRVFEPFYTTKGVGKGTGLGLSMVHGVVQQHNGLIHLYSEPGIGTTFKIYLPAVDSMANEAIACEERQLDVNGTETILLAEDDLIVRKLASRILESSGYKVLQAENGEAAVSLFREFSDEVAIVLLDVVMPKMDGRHALKEIRQIRPDVPAIFCSGYDPHMARTVFCDIEDVRLLDKPFDPGKLLTAVRHELNEAIEALHEFRESEADSYCDSPLHADDPSTPIDSAALVARCMGNYEFATSLLEEFEKSGLEYVERIAQCAANCLSSETADEAHSLKGAAGIIGADRLHSIAADIEQRCRDDVPGGLEDVLTSLKDEMARCLQFIERTRQAANDFDH